MRQVARHCGPVTIADATVRCNRFIGCRPPDSGRGTPAATAEQPM